MSRRLLAVPTCLVLLAGCGGGDGESGPPTVTVTAGTQQVPLQPTQYCLSGSGERYQTTPPIIQVEPDTTLTIRVPAAVADQGWSVQVFDDQLENSIGEVDVPADTQLFSGINSSDVSPAGFYLVVVEDSTSDCGGLSGAWPVGFVRTGGDITDQTGTDQPAAPSS